VLDRVLETAGRTDPAAVDHRNRPAAVAGVAVDIHLPEAAAVVAGEHHRRKGYYLHLVIVLLLTLMRDPLCC